MIRSEVSLGRSAVDLLVDLLELLSFLLSNIKSNREVVVIFDQAFDGASTVLKVRR